MYFKWMKIGILIFFILTIGGESFAKKNKKKAPSDHSKSKEALKKKDKMKEMVTEIPMKEEMTLKMDNEHKMAEMSTDSPPKDEDSSGERVSPKKSVKNFTCQVTGALLSMASSIKELNDDIKAIKAQMFEKCPGFHVNETQLEHDMLIDGNTTDETEVEEQPSVDGSTTTPLPPIPTECDEPFRPVASSCYYILYYPPDWKTWGDANAYCQSLGGTLAAPYRQDDLRAYLLENFSNVFWVGAKMSEIKKDEFEWLNGRKVTSEDWRDGHPTRIATKHCVYLEYFSGYKAINYYCGEKFSFVCEKRTETE